LLAKKTLIKLIAGIELFNGTEIPLLFGLHTSAKIPQNSIDRMSAKPTWHRNAQLDRFFFPFELVPQKAVLAAFGQLIATSLVLETREHPDCPREALCFGQSLFY
jgi:hypothetical protein